MKLFLIVATVIIFLSPGLCLLQSNAAETVDPKVLFERKCKTCHSTSRAKSMSQTKEGWTKTVMKCKERKNSNITDEEAKIIIDYLSKTYGKK